ncbi:hypothetical protein Leryth_014741 [Lithospermum erythrorhizon]|nr:hypothetical protein Leryth_014741 [Lithospermum erythrorhizon]
MAMVSQGIKVQVKCDHVKKLSTSTTEQDGSFKIDDLPADHPSSIDCIAKIIGAPNQLYISRRNQYSTIVKVLGDDKHYYYTLFKPLNFYKSNPYEQNRNTKNIIGGKNSQFGSSKTFDVPVPREWGIAPTSYYFPFVPIIGIP